MINRKNSEHEHLIEALKNCPLFGNLSGGELKDILKISHIRDYSAGEKIFEDGTIGLCFYIIVKGGAVISANSGEKQTAIKEFGEGAFFSEVHLFSETFHTVSCTAKEVTRTIVISKPDLEDLVKIKPKLGIKLLLKFLDFFGQRLDELYKENIELKGNSLRQS
jgi:CRP-like cAMP-binding protein